MRVLVDECAPKALKHYLVANGQESRTVQECGLSGKQNGKLLALAATMFDAFVTVDTNLQYQQPRIAEHRNCRIAITVESAYSPATTFSSMPVSS